MKLENFNTDTCFSYLFKLTWITNTIALDCSIGVAISYFLLTSYYHIDVSLNNKIFHCFQPLYMLMDFWINAYPIRIMHSYVNVIFGSTYIIFTMAYYFCGGTNFEGNPYVYTTMDWGNHPYSASVHSTIALALVIAIRFAIYGMFRLKEVIRKRLFACIVSDTDLLRSGRNVPIAVSGSALNLAFF